MAALTVDERSRRQLQEALMEAIGPDQTDTLLSYLPPTGWADVATIRDVQALGVSLRGEIGQLRGELRGEIGQLRGEVAELRGGFGELRGEFTGLRGEFTGLQSEVTGLRGEMGTLGATLRAELHHELRVQFYALATLMVALLGLAIAVFSTGLLG